MRIHGLLIALSLGLLVSGLLVAVIKPRVSVNRSRETYSIPGGRVLVYLLAPSASSSRIVVDVGAGRDTRIILSSVSMEMLVKGTAAVFTGMLQSVGMSAVMLDRDSASKVLGMKGVSIIASGGPGRYVVSGVDKPVILFVYPGSSGGEVSLSITRYNMLVSLMNEKRMGVAAAAAAVAALLLIARDEFLNH